MHSLRRVALRSAVAASRSAAVKPQTSSLLARVSQNVEIKTAIIPAARYFSQSFRLAEEKQDVVPEASPAEQGITSESQQAATTTSSSGLDARDDGETDHGIFVRNLVFDASESHLQEAFEKFGEITKVAIAKDARGLSRGYGFVWFNTKEAADQATTETDGSFWHGRRIHVSPRAKKQSTRTTGTSGVPSTSLYIGNIPYETTDAELNKIFRDLDGVKDIRVAVDRTTGWPRGFAHADFRTTDEAVHAFGKLQEATLGGRKLRVDYAAASNRWNRKDGSERSGNSEQSENFSESV